MITYTETALELAIETSANHGCPDSFHMRASATALSTERRSPKVLGVKLADLASVHRDWIETALRKGKLEREGRWTESVAVGSRGYVEQIRRGLESRGRYRVIEQVADSHILRETAEDYGYDSRCKMAGLSRESAPL